MVKSNDYRLKDVSLLLCKIFTCSSVVHDVRVVVVRIGVVRCSDVVSVRRLLDFDVVSVRRLFDFDVVGLDLKAADLFLLYGEWLRNVAAFVNLALKI